MNYQKLELHIAQVERAIMQFRCKFHDERKQKVYDDLVDLFKKIKSSKAQYTTFNDNKLVTTKEILNEVYLGIEHLHYLKTKEVPEELIFCLEVALKDWIDNHKDFLIVTSLNRKLEEFAIYVSPKRNQDVLKQNILNLFGHNYEQSLIKINKPHLFINDFISSVPLYHELGHFVDRHFQITETILFNEPKLNYVRTLGQSEILKTYHHYSEFFADLFAAQYIGNTCSEYINYAFYQNPDSHTHPSTAKRTDIVQAFLDNRSGVPEIEYIKQWTFVRSKRKIEIRNKPLSFDPFVAETSKKITDLFEIHSLFINAWKNWLDENSPIQVKYNDPTVACDAINKVAKKSIRLSMPKKNGHKMGILMANVSNTVTTIQRNLVRR